ncbi:hypothetical protein RAS1_26040 [Phycisphaerae bacterium RAS1]|nr:hypothetical protein RAS1_26040 [Phycisphaerae bacterium RAS1]
MLRQCAAASWFSRAAVVVTAFTGAVALAQDIPSVTAISSPAAAKWTAEGAETTLAELSLPLDKGLLEVAAAESAMMFASVAKAVIIVSGPASVAFDATEERLTVHLLSGRMSITTTKSQAPDGLFVRVGSTDSGKELASGFVVAGATYFSCDAASIDVARTGGDTAEMPFRFASGELHVANGQRVTAAGDSVHVSSAAEWVAQSGFGAAEASRRVGLASAGIARFRVQKDLVNTVVAWDREAGSQRIIQALELRGSRPEIRTVVLTISGQIARASSSAAAGGGGAITGANQVPLISPGAISVGNLSRLLDNTLRAATNLGNTRSQGFGRQSLLTVPGRAGGGRTVGPAGAAAP